MHEAFLEMLENCDDCYFSGSQTVLNYGNWWPDGWTDILFPSQDQQQAARMQGLCFFCLRLSDVPVAHVCIYCHRLVNSCCSHHYTRFQSGRSLEMAAVCESGHGAAHTPIGKFCTASCTPTGANYCRHNLQQLELSPIYGYKVPWSTEKKTHRERERVTVAILSCTSTVVQQFKLLISVCLWNRS